MDKKTALDVLRTRTTEEFFNTSAVGKLLNISTKMVHTWTARGDLQATNPNERIHLFSLEDIADFCVAHPSYLGKTTKEELPLNEQEYNTLSQAILRMLRGQWKYLSNYIEAEEIASEIIVAYTKKVDNKDNFPNFTIINNCIKNYWRDWKRSRVRNEGILAISETDRANLEAHIKMQFFEPRWEKVRQYVQHNDAEKEFYLLISEWYLQKAVDNVKKIKDDVIGKCLFEFEWKYQKQLNENAK